MIPTFHFGHEFNGLVPIILILMINFFRAYTLEVGVGARFKGTGIQLKYGGSRHDNQHGRIIQQLTIEQVQESIKTYKAK